MNLVDDADTAGLERRALLQRNAQLIVELRRIVRIVHGDQAHAAAQWFDCDEAPCVDVWEAIEHRPAPHRRPR